MKRIYKNNDVTFNLTSNNYPFLLSDVKTIKFTFYTTNRNDIIEKSEADIHNGILVIRWYELETLSEGVLQYDFTVDDGTVRTSEQNTSDYYIVTGSDIDVPRDGKDGTIFFPSVSPEGVITWTNEDGRPNPEPIDIHGLSLYELMVRDGKFTGTEEEFLNDYQDSLDALKTEISNSQSQTEEVKTALGNIEKEEKKILEAETQRGSNETTRQANETQRGIDFKFMQAQFNESKSNVDKARTDTEKATKEAQEATQLTKSATSDAIKAKTDTEQATKDTLAAKELTEQATATSQQTTEQAKQIIKDTTKVKEDTILVKDEAVKATANANEAATTIDSKINPVIENDKLQDEKLGTLELRLTPLEAMNFPQWFKESVVCWYNPYKQGLKNSDFNLGAATLKDLSGNGRDMRLHGFEGKLMSGMDGYGIIKDSKWSYEPDRCDGYTVNNYTITIKNIKISDVSRSVIIQNIESVSFEGAVTKVRVSGLNENSIIIIGDEYKKITKNNIVYDIILKANENNDLLIRAVNCIGLDITIEFLPLYPHALVFDGKDDYGVAENMPTLTQDKGYTVLINRQIIKTTLNDTGSTISCTAGGWEFSPFAMERIQNGTFYSFNYDEGTIIKNKFTTYQNISYQTSQYYNGLNIKKGNIEAFDKSILQLSKITSGYISYALYETLLFNRDLTLEEIDWVKENIMGEGLNEAPKDDKIYGRKNGKWEALPPLTGYEEIMAYGVEWDTEVADKHPNRVGNPLLHKSLPIQSQYKGCIANQDGINYYLNANDWSKKADGTPSILNGTDGDVYVHTPNFYGRSWEKGTKRRVMISSVKIDDTWIEIPELLVGAYKCTVSDGKTRTVVNDSPEFRGGGNRSANDAYLDTIPSKSDLNKPRTSISRETMRGYAKAANEELLCYEYYKWIFYWNYVIEYANFDSQDTFNSELTPEGYHQGGLGRSVTYWDYSIWLNFNGNYPITPNGYCNSIGNGTGVKELVISTGEPDNIDKTFYVSRWRGFDNLFGDVYTNLEGIVIKRDADNEPSRVMTTTDTSAFDDSEANKTLAGMEIAQDGYIKEFALGNTAEIIPSAIAGDGSTYKCDYHYSNVTYTGTRALMVGGDALVTTSAGVGYFYAKDTVGSVSAAVGFRTVRKINK